MDVSTLKWIFRVWSLMRTLEATRTPLTTILWHKVDQILLYCGMVKLNILYQHISLFLSFYVSLRPVEDLESRWNRKSPALPRAPQAGSDRRAGEGSMGGAGGRSRRDIKPWGVGTRLWTHRPQELTVWGTLVCVLGDTFQHFILHYSICLVNVCMLICRYVQDLDALFRKLDRDQDGRVSLSEFQSGLFRQHHHGAPISTSTPARPKPQRSISKVRIKPQDRWCWKARFIKQSSMWTWECDSFIIIIYIIKLWYTENDRIHVSSRSVSPVFLLS